MLFALQNITDLLEYLSAALSDKVHTGVHFTCTVTHLSLYKKVYYKLHTNKQKLTFIKHKVEHADFVY